VYRTSLLAVLVACAGEPDPTHTKPPTPTPTPTLELPSETEALESAGFTVQSGGFLFATMEGCCDPDANCRGNNVSTPYGMHAVPPAPNYYVEQHGIVDDFGDPEPGTMTEFRLREDEALVLLGETPPPASYFGFRSYLGQREGEDIVASLGASLNHLVIGAQRGTDDIWKQPLAIVTTADASVEQSVTEALVASGWDPAYIHNDRITHEVTRMGLNQLGDSFFTVLRVAEYADPAAGAAWQANHGLRVLRLTPEVEQAVWEPHPWPELPERGTGTNEDAWLASLDALDTAIRETHAGVEPLATEALPYWRETLECIDDVFRCTGDLRDRFIASSPQFALGPDDFIVVFGVNHARTGKSNYSSFAVQTIANQRGVAAITSASMPGSTAAWLPDDPLTDDLYAWTIARDCAPHDPDRCLEVPTTCPGAPTDEQLKVVFRAYLESETGAAPAAEEVQWDRLLLYRGI